MSNPPIRVPSAARQVIFHQLLLAARKMWLIDALQEALREIDPELLKTQLLRYVPKDAQRILAGVGIRDEIVFPVPVVLEEQPTLLGYYRLLLGISQKGFYRAETGISRFRSMEASGNLSDIQRSQLPALCQGLNQALADLVRQLSPAPTLREISELTLLTLGAQLYGGNNNTIGKQATQGIFLAIVEVLKDRIIDRTNRSITINNAEKNEVTVALAGDPDVKIQAREGASLNKRAAIEIKGGSDISNAHNRAGEAEKSHQKAKNQGFSECWTIIRMKGLDLRTLRAESPTTNLWFDAAQVLGRSGPDWGNFVRELSGVTGIPLK